MAKSAALNFTYHYCPTCNRPYEFSPSDRIYWTLVCDWVRLDSDEDNRSPESILRRCDCRHESLARIITRMSILEFELWRMKD